MAINDKAEENNEIKCFGLLKSNSGSTGRMQDMGRYKVSRIQEEIEEKIGERAKRMGYQPNEIVKYTIIVEPKKKQ